MGSVWGKRVRVGPDHQKGEKIAINAQPRRGQHGEGQGGTIKSDMKEEDCCEQSEQPLIELNFYTNMIAGVLILIIAFLSFRRINHLALKPFALILFLPVAEHHVKNM
jgi:hypothetical protein